MSYLLGIITGLLVGILILAVEIYLRPRNQGLPKLKRFLEEKTRAKGKIIHAKPDAIRSAEEKIKDNEARGRDTQLDDIIHD